MGKGYPEKDQVLMEFYPDSQLGDNVTNWWAPNVRCLMHMLRAAGFVDVAGWKLRQTPKNLTQCRGFAAGRKPGAPLIPGMTV